jgi:hypothetical protein
MTDNGLITVTQRGRKVEVYEWAVLAGKEIAERTALTAIVHEGTDPAIHYAEIITDCAINSNEPPFGKNAA